MNYTAKRIKGFKETIFSEITSLAIKHDAINLGQGFPNFPGPDFLKEAAVSAIRSDINQYAPSNGRAKLRKAITSKMEKHYNLTVNPDTEIVVTSGATEAIFSTILGIVNPKDEVIVFEPYFDTYLPAVKIAGGIPKFYTLKPTDWKLDRDKLESIFSNKTKLVILNSPHNPTGKVFNREELLFISTLCKKYDAIVLSDEVYEHIIFDELKHIPIATLPGMRSRTITISSLGKTFSVTGWKVGWAIAPQSLIKAISQCHQLMTFCGAAPLQEAAASAILTDESFYEKLKITYQQKRDFLFSALIETGLKPIIPGGTYFIMANIGHLGFENDVVFCRYLIKEIGVATIPPSAFYHNPSDGAKMIRFAFCKTDEVLQQASEKLKRLK